MALRTQESVSSALLVVIPSHDMRAVVPTLMALERVSHLLHRELQTVVGEGSNIPRARNVAVQGLRDRAVRDSDPWILWLDSDIWLADDSVVAVAEAIRWAEAHDAAIVANYRMSDGRNVLMKRRAPDFPEPGEDAHYTDEELAALPDYAEVGMAGLGFVYLRHPLTYRFHADDLGEDIYFWQDHPEMRLHLAKQIHLGHKKLVLLT